MWTDIFSTDSYLTGLKARLPPSLLQTVRLVEEHSPMGEAQGMDFINVLNKLLHVKVTGQQTAEQLSSFLNFDCLREYFTESHQVQP